MCELRASPSVSRLLFAVVWAVLLAGCIPHPVDPPSEAPANVVATPGDGVIALAWSASDGATGYSVKRAASPGGPYTRIAAPGSTSYADPALVNGTTYYYVVSAFNKGGESANSTEVSAIPDIPRIPPPPANVATTTGNSSAVISWSASAGAASYHVKRATTSGGPYTQIAAAVSTTYSDAPLVNGTTYYYVVSAANSLGESADSLQVSVTPSPPPPTTFGTWTNVTPAGANLVDGLSCGNFGTSSIQADPANPANLYAHFDCQGIWKSTDFGVTWSGPINTGTNGLLVSDCAGGISIPPGSTASVPTIYRACIRGSGTGFWKSVDGGVNWTRHTVTPTARQDYYSPAIDPYDPNHLLMTAHEFNSVVQSFDGGLSWTSVTLNNGMLLNGGSAAIFFINTGNAITTARTWLYIGDGANSGTWRTTDSAATWTRVDDNERLAGTQIYQPDSNGVVFMAGIPGVSRSVDYGQTWTRLGTATNRSVVFGTNRNVYSMYGIPLSGASLNPNFQVASQPGTGTWVTPGTPAGLINGPAQVAVVNDGLHAVFLGAMWNAGIWRYVEP